MTNALAGNYNSELYLSPTSDYVSGLAITVSNAASGNGTFLLPVFANFIINAPTALDFSSQLIGHVTDFNFGVYSNDFTSPSDAAPLIIRLGDGETVDLESIDPIVAVEPLSVGIFGVGLIALGIARGCRKV